MTICKECGLPVYWLKQQGKWQCFNRGDNRVHWDTCSARKFSQVKRDGKFFKKTIGGNEVEGYKAPKRTQLTMIRPLKPLKGSRYTEDGCDCGRPPWELCSAKCEHALPREPARGPA